MDFCLTAEPLVVMLLPKFALRSSVKKAEGKLKLLLLLEIAWIFEHLIWFALIVFKTNTVGKMLAIFLKSVLQVEEVIMTSFFLLKPSCFLSSQKNKKHPTDGFWVSRIKHALMHVHPVSSWTPIYCFSAAFQWFWKILGKSLAI